MDCAGRLPTQASPAAKKKDRGPSLRGNNGVGRRFAYDDRQRLIGTYDGRGRRVQEYIYLDEIPVAVVDRRGVRYIHTDHLGTARAVSNPDGAVIWRWHADPFSTTAPDNNPDGRRGTFTLKLRFPGQYYDAETDRHYNYFRTYDPEVGRYITSDPIGFDGDGPKLYSFALNHPLNLIDPKGLASLCPPGQRAAGKNPDGSINCVDNGRGKNEKKCVTAFCAAGWSAPGERELRGARRSRFRQQKVPGAYWGVFGCMCELPAGRF